METRFSLVFSGALALVLACGTGGVERGNRCLSDDNCATGEVCIRGFCGAACTTNDECPAGQVCEEGACLTIESSTCTLDSECTRPPSLCQQTDGAQCILGRCEYPDVPCNTPGDPVCSADNETFIQFQAPGTCDSTTGACRYEEIPEPCPDCDTSCLGACEDIECTANFGCRSNPRFVTNSGGGCTCEFIAVPSGAPCPDENPCTTMGECDGAGECVSVPVSDGESCVDDEDEPIQGVCLASACVECVGNAECDDGNPCTTNTCNDDNTCASQDRDGFSCTLDDSSMGTCLADLCVECLTDDMCDDGNSCTVDTCIVDPADPFGRNQICQRASVPVGAACLDGESGVCNGEPACVECLSDANEPDGANALCDVTGVSPIDVQCRIATCVNDECSTANEPNGRACDDQVIATIGEICSEGQCVGCLERQCQSFTIANGACVYVDFAEGAGCDDGNDATQGDTCSRDQDSNDLVCLGCDQLDDEVDCENFENQSGECVNLGFDPSADVACDDDNACTDGDTCSGTACFGSTPPSKLCNGPCEAGCDTTSGECGVRPSGTACTTNSCRSGQSCNGTGGCVGGTNLCESNESCSSNVCICSTFNRCNNGAECCTSAQVCCDFSGTEVPNGGLGTTCQSSCSPGGGF